MCRTTGLDSIEGLKKIPLQIHGGVLGAQIIREALCIVTVVIAVLFTDLRVMNSSIFKAI